jgi:RNA polymerase sigma-70 factor (ECF subfamily)
MRIYDTDKNLLSVAKLERAKGGLDAFEKILTRYERLIYNTAFRYFADPNDALNATHESVLKMYKGLNRVSLPENGSLKTWICSVTVKTCLGMSRKFRPISIEFTDEILLTTLPDTKDAAAPLKRIQKIMEALYKLPDNYCMVIILKDVQGLCYNELAAALDISVGKAKRRLLQARTGLIAGYNNEVHRINGQEQLLR